MENEDSKWRGMRLSDILFEKGYINRMDHDQAIENEKKSHHTAKSFIIEHHLATQDQISECLALKHGLPYLADSEIKFSLKRAGSAMKSIPYNLALKERFLPFDFDAAKNILSVLVREPMDSTTANQLRSRIPGVVLKCFVAQESTILKLIYNQSKHFHHGSEEPAPQEIEKSSGLLKYVAVAIVLVGLLIAAGYGLFFWEDSAVPQESQAASAVMSDESGGAGDSVDPVSVDDEEGANATLNSDGSADLDGNAENSEAWTENEPETDSLVSR